jgi:anti-anti-sigma regulatory factor
MEKIPILRMGEFLLVTIQIDMHDQLALKLQDDLSNAIQKNASRGVLIDISSLEMVDSFIGRMVADISGMGKILGAESWWACSPRWRSLWSSWDCPCPASQPLSMSNAAWRSCVGR